jgi:MFS family permease
MADSNLSTPAGGPSAARKVGLNFILVCVFIDMLGIGLIIPVLPMLIGEFAGGKELQAQWYGALVTLFGLMQFIFMPILGALSDRIGRRPVLLISIIGVGLNFLVTGLAVNVWMLALGRIIGGSCWRAFRWRPLTPPTFPPEKTAPRASVWWVRPSAWVSSAVRCWAACSAT